MTTDVDLKKMYWHSRRGMLELDLILLPFVEKKLPLLAAHDRQLYRELLEQEDQDIYAWLVLRVEPPSDSLKAIVDRIVKP